MTLNKSQLISDLIKKLEQSLLIATRAADDAKDLATHEQSKPETQYDTVGLEASYLAHGQSQRVAELKLALSQWQQILKQTIKQSPTKPNLANSLLNPLLNASSNEAKAMGLIEHGALIQLENDHAVLSWCLLGPSAGGMKLQQNNQKITVITESSPMGKRILGKQLHDEFELIIQDKKSWFEIVSIC